MSSLTEEIRQLHEGGKMETQPKQPIASMEELSKIYTPGVAEICMEIANDPAKAYQLTIKKIQWRSYRTEQRC